MPSHTYESSFMRRFVMSFLMALLVVILVLVTNVPYFNKNYRPSTFTLLGNGTKTDYICANGKSQYQCYDISCNAITFDSQNCTYYSCLHIAKDVPCDNTCDSGKTLNGYISNGECYEHNINSILVVVVTFVLIGLFVCCICGCFCGRCYIGFEIGNNK